MMESSQEKKKIFYMVVLILTFIIMLVGASLAYYSLVSSQKKEGTVLYTGTLEINYIDGIYLKDPLLYPLEKVDYTTKDKVYRNNFAVRSSGTLDQNIKLTLNISKNEFTPNALKYAMSNGYVQQSGPLVLADNLYLASNDTAKYTLIIWLDSTNYNQNYEMGNVVTGSIEVEAIQVKY